MRISINQLRRIINEEVVRLHENSQPKDKPTGKCEEDGCENDATEFAYNMQKEEVMQGCDDHAYKMAVNSVGRRAKVSTCGKCGCMNYCE